MRELRAKKPSTLKRRNPSDIHKLQKRRARDSNPQPVSRHLISSQAANHSLTLPAEHPIKYELSPGGKISAGCSSRSCAGLSDFAEGAVRVKRIALRLPVKG